MKRTLLKIGKLLIRSLALLFGSILLYWLTAYIASFIPANAQSEQPEKGVEIFISSSGVHLDFILPYQHEQFDWGKYLDLADYNRKGKKPTYLAIGWGDKGFFLNTPTWDDLETSTAVNALLLPSASAIHIILNDHKPKVSENTRRVLLTEAQFRKLNQAILASFLMEGGKLMPIAGEGYAYMDDKFYESPKNYHLINTCNEWANQILKDAGIKTAIWSPFDWGVLRQLPSATSPN